MFNIHLQHTLALHIYNHTLAMSHALAIYCVLPPINLDCGN